MADLFGQFESLEKQVRERLRELESAVAEHSRLRELAGRLGINLEQDGAGDTADRSVAPAAKGRAGRTARRSTARRASTSGGARQRRAPGTAAEAGTRQEQVQRVADAAAAGAAAPAAARTPARSAGTSGSGTTRRDQVLAAVRANPGTTVPAIGKDLGVDPTSLYRVVRRLESEGEISKDGPNLRPVGA